MTRRGRIRAALGLCCLLAAGASLADARADPQVAEAGAGGPGDQVPPLARMRLELRGALGVRRDALTLAGARSEAEGQALSDLVLGGAWFARGSPFGVAARLELDRFSLRSEQDAGASSSATAFELVGALAGRLRPGSGALALEAQLGYGLLHEPLAPARGADRPFALAALGAHGPFVGAGVTVQASDAVELDLVGRAFPTTFGGRYGEQAADVRRFTGGVTAGVRVMETARARLSAVIGYEVARTTGAGSGLEVDQLHQQLGLGLRVSEAPPRAPLAVVVPPPPVRSARARLRGVVRAEAGPGEPGEPLADVAVSVKGGPTTRTAADGSFALGDLPAGLLEVALAREDLLPGAEVVSLPAGGEATLAVALRRAAAPEPAVVRGQVRGEGGAPVVARIRLVERDEQAATSADGQFRFEIPPGRYTLTIDADGFVSQRKSVVVRAGEHDIFNVDLQEQR
jgi:hypothetical protein